MDGNPYARYKTTMLIAAGLFAVWGVLSILDANNLPFPGYRTDGNNTVTQVLPDTPAEQAGMQVGDYIRSIGGVAVEDAAARARQPRAKIGETRTIVVERDEATANLDLTFAPLPGNLLTLTIVGILMGFCFLIVGLWPYLRAPNKRTLLLAIFGLTLGFSFFGGPNLDSYALRTVVSIVSTLLVITGFATLLHFTLVFPKPKALLAKRHMRDYLYGPAALVFLFLLYRGLFQPAATSAMNVITGILIGGFILVYFGLALTAFIHSYVKADRQERAQFGLTYVLGGVVAGFVPVLAVVLVRLIAPSVIIPGANYFFLSLVLIPISLALAVVKGETAPVSAPIQNEARSHVSLSA